MTIGVIPRERFSWAARCLRRLLDTPAGIDYQLVIVDCATPARYLRQIEAVVAGRPNVDFIRLDRHVLPNHARKLVAEQSTTEFTCMLENDNYVEPGWLGYLVEACERFQAAAAAPRIMEKGRYHGDANLGAIQLLPAEHGRRLEILPLDIKHEQPQALPVDNTECHCLLLRSETIERLDLFDPELSTHDFLDITLKLRESGEKLVFEPRSRIDFHSPPRVEHEERAFFRRRWDLEAGRISTDRVRQRWNISELPSARAFSRERLHRESWAQLSLYTLTTRIWRRLRTRYRAWVLRWPALRLQEYTAGAIPPATAGEARPNPSLAGVRD